MTVGLAAACSKGNPAVPSAVTTTASSSGPLVIRQCQTISASGTYTLAADISSAASGCLTLQNATNVALDCGGHSIGSTGPMPDGGYAIKANGSVNVTIRNCSVRGSIAVDGLKDSQLVDNRIDGSYTQHNSTGVRFAGNTVTFDPAKPAASGIVALYFGSNNTVTGNQIDGTWDGNVSAWGSQGSDDGIQLTNESNDVVEGNAVRNAWDAGIEGVGFVNATVIANNTITNIGYTGVGSYHGTNWTGNTIRGNQVSHSPGFGCIAFSDTRQSPGVTAAVFQNNLFEGNVFRDPVHWPSLLGGIVPPALMIDLTPPSSFALTASGNVVRGNDFDPQSPAIKLVPTSAFTDGSR